MSCYPHNVVQSKLKDESFQTFSPERKLNGCKGKCRGGIAQTRPVMIHFAEMTSIMAIDSSKEFKR